MGKISDYTRVLAAKLADVFVCDQTDNGTTETKSATVEQIGTAIGTLQNFADLDTSNKTLVDSINEIASYTPVYGNTASGAIATFDTSLALPLQDCTIDINAVQEAGTPTPSSPKLISGFTGANIHVADDETPHVIDNVTAISWQSEAGTVYGGSLDVTSGVLTVTWTKKLMSTWTWSYNDTSYTYGFFYLANDISDKASNMNALAECFVNNGNGRNALSDNEIGFWNNTGGINRFCVRADSIANLTAWNTFIADKYVAYELATPVTYQLTPTQISTIVGTNNVFTDTNGYTSVVYACSLKDYIDSQ